MQLSTGWCRSLDLEVPYVVQYGDQPTTRFYALDLERFQGAEKVDPLTLIVHVESCASDWQVIGTNEVFNGFIVQIFDVHVQVSDEFFRWVLVVRWIVRTRHVYRSKR